MSETAAKDRDVLGKMREDLRTPLTRILECAQALQGHAEELGQEVFLPELYKIQSAGKNLLELMNELLGSWATMEDVDLPRLRFEIRGALNHVVGYIEMLQERAEELDQRGFLPDLEIMHGECRLLVDLTRPPTRAEASRSRPLAVLHADSAPVRAEEVVSKAGTLLVVDDSAPSRNALGRELQRQGYRIVHASSGPAAMERVREEKFDLILLDTVMPGMSGYEMLQWLKADTCLRDTPVVMISAMNETESVVRCLVIGAEDYIAKPFDPVLLNIRIGATLERARWRQREQMYQRQLEEEKLVSERLLHSILPKPIARRLHDGEEVIADALPSVTILFADLVSVTETLAGMNPAGMVGVLNEIFTAFDLLTEQHAVEKIRTSGSTYMAAAGLHSLPGDHANAVMDLALAMQREVASRRASLQRPLHVRIGIHTGPVVAGVIGLHKFSYDLWGETVEIAGRMESHGQPDCIHVSAATYDLLHEGHRFEQRSVEMSERGMMTTYLWQQQLAPDSRPLSI
jgi:class 3 adenylate cyclase